MLILSWRLKGGRAHGPMSPPKYAPACMSEGVQRSDRRDQHQKGNQLDKARLRFVEEHIASFPAKESYYCRKSSKKRYLDQNLNISKMHTLYVKKCEDLGMLPVKDEVYQKIFAQFNIGFFQQKKNNAQHVQNTNK